MGDVCLATPMCMCLYYNLTITLSVLPQSCVGICDRGPKTCCSMCGNRSARQSRTTYGTKCMDSSASQLQSGRSRRRGCCEPSLRLVMEVSTPFVVVFSSLSINPSKQPNPSHDALHPSRLQHGPRPVARDCRARVIVGGIGLFSAFATEHHLIL